MRNQVNVIFPFCKNGVWMFSDSEKGLQEEPFVSGADVILENLARQYRIQDAENGFILYFSSEKFPAWQVELYRQEPEDRGYWYEAPTLNARGWLCPALFKYFIDAPERLYLQLASINRKV